MAQTATAEIPCIDADGHIMERVADVRRYLAAPWKDRKTPIWPGDQPWDTQLFESIGYPANYEREMTPDVQREIWLKAMDEHNIETAVLFPTGVHSTPKLQETDFAIAVCTAANTLFGKEFSGKRLRPVGVLPMKDPKAAVRELERCVDDLGITAFEVATTGLPFAMGDSFYDPIYEAAQRKKAQICIHGTRHWAHEVGADKLRTFAEIHAYAFPAALIMQFTSVMCQGVPVRFPDLKIAFLEIGVTWLPYYLDRLDEHWHLRRREMPHLSERPSDVLRKSSIVLSIEADETFLLDTIDFVGADHFVFASDIPHWDSEWPHNIQGIRRHPKLSAEVKRKILYDNAKTFYGL
jgi:predicted TIM-barrel fold metal-dependent hydrolase